MTKQRFAALVLVVAGLLATSACGSTAPYGGTDGGGTPTSVAPAATSGGNGY